MIGTSTDARTGTPGRIQELLDTRPLIGTRDLVNHHSQRRMLAFNPGATAAAWSVLVDIGIPFTEVLAILILSVLFPPAIHAKWLPEPRRRCSHGHLKWLAGVRDRALSERNVRSTAVARSISPG